MDDFISGITKLEHTCTFRISDIADLTGLSVSGVIYLEKKGAIHPLREENGYRYYSEDVLSLLGILRSYERLGFSIKEASNLIATDTEGALLILQKRKKDLLKQIAHIDLLSDRFETALQKMKTVELVQSPAFCFFPYWEKYCDLKSLTKAEQRKLRKVDVSWMGAFPAVCYCSKVDLSENEINWQKGMIVTAEDAKNYDLVMHPKVENYPPRRCLHTYSENGTDGLYECLRDYAAKLHLKLSSPMLAIIQHIGGNNFDEKTYLIEIYAPVEEEIK